MSTTTFLNYFKKYQIPFPIPNKRILFLFDVDGVVCEALPYQSEVTLTRDEYNNMITKRECLPIFLNTVNAIDNEVDIYENYFIKFLTGRYEWSKTITEVMFQNAGLGYLTGEIMYYPNELKWYCDDYIVHKTNTIRNFLDQYDLVYFFDDNEPLMTYLQKVFDHEPRLKVIHIK